MKKASTKKPANARYGLDPEVWQAAKEEMRAICIQAALARRTITYGELAQQMMVVSPHPGSYVFQAMLREMCSDDERAGHIMLCHIVVSRATGMPGAGYFKWLATEFPRSAETDLIERWRAECEATYDYWNDFLARDNDE